MAKEENSDPLNKITSTVNERDKKIWENEARSLCINKETEKLKSEISRLKKATQDMVKEDKDIEKQLQELIQAVVTQKQTLQTSMKSLLTLKVLKETLLQQANEMKSKYSSTLDMYHDEFQEYRSIYENACKSYKDLRSQEVELKKLEIKHLDSEVKMNTLRKTQEQFRNIQRQIFQTTIVKFAKFYSLYHKKVKMDLELRELKAEEKQLLRQHLELVEAVKTKQKKKIAQKNRARMEKTVEKVSDESVKENKELPASDKLQRFLSEDIKPFSLTSLDSCSPQPKLNEDHSKVRILDVKVMKRPVPKASIMKKPNLELRKRMENIMENTKRSASRSGSTQVTPTSSQKKQETVKAATPTSSQKSQNDAKATPHSGASQSMKNMNLEDQPTSQEKSLPSQTIKQAQLFAIPEKGASAKQESISKFFNKKKSVTFQTQEKNSQERVNKFSFQSERVAQDAAKRFQFSGSKEESSVRLPMDIFPKPFAFPKEVPPKTEEKKSELSFGVFDSLNKKPTPSESEPATSASTNVSFTGPSYNTYGNESDEKKAPEEMTFDPFDASFNRSLSQAPLNPVENVAQPAESSTTFNFLGLQNKNNFFSMF